MPVQDQDPSHRESEDDRTCLDVRPANHEVAQSQYTEPNRVEEALGGILVVDDNELIRRLLAVAFPYHGFRAWVAASANEAIEIYKAHFHRIDMILLDVRMPVMDGPTTLAMLREINSHVSFCFMSGDFGNYSRQNLLDLGAQRVFEKPFDLATVIRSIAELITPSVTDIESTPASSRASAQEQNVSNRQSY